MQSNILFMFHGCSSHYNKELHGLVVRILSFYYLSFGWPTGTGGRTYFGHSRLVILKRDMQKCAHSFKTRKDWVRLDKTSEIRWDKPRISRDWAILVLLVSSNLNRDNKKCARLKQDKISKIRRSNEDRPLVPGGHTFQHPITVECFIPLTSKPKRIGWRCFGMFKLFLSMMERMQKSKRKVPTTYMDIRNKISHWLKYEEVFDVFILCVNIIMCMYHIMHWPYYV